jgi:ParB/RepB/Spo0J family partition protein
MAKVKPRKPVLKKLAKLGKSKKPGETGDPRVEIVYLKARSILLDNEFNVRKELGGRNRIATDDEKAEGWLSDVELKESIQKQGLLQFPKVRIIKDAYYATMGFRRVRACMSIDKDYLVPCILQTATGDAKADERTAYFDNLAENLQRRNLRVYEMAERFMFLQNKYKITATAIAKAMGLSARYVANLIRVREKLHPDLWNKFVKLGDSVRFNHLQDVCVLPLEKQIEAYAAKLKEKNAGKGGRPKGSKSNPRSEESGDNEHETRPTGHELLVYLNDLMKPSFKGSKEWKEGASFALRVAVGNEAWPA